MIGLTIDMKRELSHAGRVDLQVDHLEAAVITCWEQLDTRWYPRAAYRVWRDQEDDEARGYQDRAANAHVSHSDSSHDKIIRLGAICSTNYIKSRFLAKANQ